MAKKKKEEEHLSQEGLNQQLTDATAYGDRAKAERIIIAKNALKGIHEEFEATHGKPVSWRRIKKKTKKES